MFCLTISNWPCKSYWRNFHHNTAQHVNNVGRGDSHLYQKSNEDLDKAEGHTSLPYVLWVMLSDECALDSCKLPTGS